MCGERETYVREHKEDNGRKESSLLPFSFQFKSPAITQTCARHSPNAIRRLACDARKKVTNIEIMATKSSIMST